MSSTPILDRLEPLPEPVSTEGKENSTKPRSHYRRNAVIVFLVVALTAGWIAFMVFSPNAYEVARVLSARLDRLFLGASSQASPYLVFVWSLLVCPVLAFCYVVIVHECGHLLAGFCAGFEFVSIRFGPVQIKPPFRLSLRRNRESGPTGAVRMLPRTPTCLGLRTAVFTLGGPVANLASAALLPRFASDSLLAAWFVVLSYTIGITNLASFRGPGFISDGKRLLMLVRQSGQSKRAFAVVRLHTDLLDGVAPENFNAEWISLAIAERDDSPLTMLAYLLAFESAWYTSTPDEAARLLETALQSAKNATPALRENAICNAGIFQARKRARADLAREWLAALLHVKESSEHRLHIESGILEAEGDITGAIARLDQAIKARLALPSNKQREAGLRSLERWRKELWEKMPAGVEAARS